MATHSAISSISIDLKHLYEAPTHRQSGLLKPNTPQNPGKLHNSLILTQINIILHKLTINNKSQSSKGRSKLIQPNQSKSDQIKPCDADCQTEV
jgi:hypothetical protein